jgi:hypothetical protein
VTDTVEDQLAELRAEVARLSEAAKAAPPAPPKKDIWERLSTLSTISSSLILGLVGLVATNIYNDRQLDQQRLENERTNALKQAESESHARIEQAQVLDKFLHYVVSNDQQQREFGYAMFASLGEGELALRIITFRKDPAGVQLAQGLKNSSDPATREAATRALLSIRQQRTIRSIVLQFEGTRYDTVTPFNQDIMYGIGGWRIGDGRLSKLLVDYAKMDLARDAGKITLFLERLETKDTSLASDTTFISILRDAATDPVMQTTQETSFDTETLDPALKVATSLGIKTPLGILLVYDSRVLGGFPAAAKATTETLGGSPANGIDEHAYVTKLDQLRHDALRQLGQRYPAFEKTWLKRADFITALIAKEDWQLDGDIALPADH